MGSSPASPESWPGDGSITSGVPKKSRIWRQADGILIGCLPGYGKDLAASRLDAQGDKRFRHLCKEGGADEPLGPSNLSVSPMTAVTRILSLIEQGNPHAAEQLLPLVYDELRKLAAEMMAQEKPGQTLQATALVHEAYLRLVASEESHPPEKAQ